jgi:hypothetical protein
MRIGYRAGLVLLVSQPTVGLQLAKFRVTSFLLGFFDLLTLIGGIVLILTANRRV